MLGKEAHFFKSVVGHHQSFDCGVACCHVEVSTITNNNIIISIRGFNSPHHKSPMHLCKNKKTVMLTKYVLIIQPVLPSRHREICIAALMECKTSLLLPMHTACIEGDLPLNESMCGVSERPDNQWTPSTQRLG